MEIRITPKLGCAVEHACLAAHLRQLISAPSGIRTPNEQIMRRFEGHQQGETKPDEAVFTESAAVKVCYVLLRLSTPSRHNRAILLQGRIAYNYALRHRPQPALFSQD